MSNFVLTKNHLREVLLFQFNSNKSAAESHRMLLEIYGADTPSIKTCEYWFRRFKSGDYETVDKERPGQPKKFEDKQLKALLDVDPCQTQNKLAVALGVDRATVSKRLSVLGMTIQKQQ